MPRLTPEQLGRVPYQPGTPNTYSRRRYSDAPITVKEMLDFVAECYANDVPEHAKVTPRGAYLVASWGRAR